MTSFRRTAKLIALGGFCYLEDFARFMADRLTPEAELGEMTNRQHDEAISGTADTFSHGSSATRPHFLPGK